MCESVGWGAGVREESAWGWHPPARWDLTDELSQVGSPGKSLEPHHDFIGNCSPLLPSPPHPSPSLPAAGRQPAPGLILPERTSPLPHGGAWLGPSAPR